MDVNPFYHSGPVVGEGFVDREEELTTLLGWLGTTPPTCVALYGPERIGKTSLLRRLCEVEGPKRHSTYRWAYLDLQGVLSPDEFWETLEKVLGAGDRDIRAALEKAPAPVVLCLDEFGKVLSRPEFTADFYDRLRSLTQTGRLALVISTLRPLKELSVPSGADVSRFFNIFRPFPLGPFSPQAARELLESRGLSKDEVEWVLANVREPRHPYHLQLLGACLWEAKRAGRPREDAMTRYREALEWEKGPSPARPALPVSPRPSGWEVAGMVAMAIAMILVVVQVISLQPILLLIAGISFVAALVFWLVDYFRRRG
ncbi:MAG: ATP-binding protein [Anaerolineae bacterium]